MPVSHNRSSHPSIFAATQSAPHSSHPDLVSTHSNPQLLNSIPIELPVHEHGNLQRPSRCHSTCRSGESQLAIRDHLFLWLHANAGLRSQHCLLGRPSPSHSETANANLSGSSNSSSFHESSHCHKPGPNSQCDSTVRVYTGERNVQPYPNPASPSSQKSSLAGQYL